jgi:hypothetical protein
MLGPPGDTAEAIANAFKHQCFYHWKFGPSRLGVYAMKTDPHDVEAPGLTEAQESWDFQRGQLIDDLERIRTRLNDGHYGSFFCPYTERLLATAAVVVENIEIPTDKELREVSE